MSGKRKNTVFYAVVASRALKRVEKWLQRTFWRLSPLNPAAPILELCWLIFGAMLCWSISELFWPILALCWLILWLRWPVLGHLGTMLVHFGAHVGPSWSYVGPTWTHFGPILAHPDGSGHSARHNSAKIGEPQNAVFRRVGSHGTTQTLRYVEPIFVPVSTPVPYLGARLPFESPILTYVGLVLTHVGCVLALCWPMLAPCSLCRKAGSR